ncbi:4-diphosphocytidyl-2-C-methyl-D-erythritol kinase [Sphingobium sp. OAS761]|uniref:4-(cytidine 5'-diphospho)-2-C-methyl-D-erythritol kinase n=1 Tax=Sphingobium sp. OAS761 TaxID=2817901 RepID=UPI00209EF090|nr:4-(cytidine 5'-diphospho)-2-C-methyl-D-erythritol kinase [Sphingobium sp. OAS761]MCP1471010.1 4-diphosphocytidyl-2-C-methyl-D-erythritol kinase [Sphingobium sp. OAS761]
MPHPDTAADAVTLAETAYAKVNVALHVRGRRSDGYHALESLFVFAEDGDLLHADISDDGAIDLIIDGPFGDALSSGPDNLVVRAARALQSYLGEQRGAVIRLTKMVPVASGIGGGSADAAATLRLLARLWDVRIDDRELADLGLPLGSDIPACIASTTQMVRGRGEHLARQTVAGLDGMPMLLVNPGVSVPTGHVFARWNGQDGGALDTGSLQALVEHGRNDLEAPAIAIAPAIADILAALRALGGLILARMSGSGATCFALFETETALTQAAMTVGGEHPDWWTMKTKIRAG